MKLLKVVSIIPLAAVQTALATPIEIEIEIPSYSTDGTELNELQQMTFDIGYGPEVFDAYVQPNITTFSRGAQDTPRQPNHHGHAVKFFNMSPETILLYWDDGKGREIRMGRVQPFAVSGTASFPGHQFFLAPVDYVEGSQKDILRRFYIDADGGGKEKMVNLYFYDPFYVEGSEEATDMNLMSLSFADLERYNIIKRTQKFDEHYRKFTGRSYLSMYPRDKPKHFMWPADYYGQEHWFTTKETYFERVPPAEEIKRIAKRGSQRVLKDDEVSLKNSFLCRFKRL